jgi:hypothetical protein
MLLIVNDYESINLSCIHTEYISFGLQISFLVVQNNG